MSATHRHTRGFSIAGEVSLSYDKDIVGDADSRIPDLTIPAGATDMEVNCPIDVSALLSLYIAADQDLTIETNNAGGSSASPDDTIALKANQPCMWAENDAWACPLTADVTKLWITNAGADDATFNMRWLVDATP